LFCTPALKEFLYQQHNLTSFENNPQLLNLFAELDDTDVISSIKVWKNHPDKTLSILCKMMIDRNLYKIKLQDTKFRKEKIEKTSMIYQSKFNLSDDELSYFVFQDRIENNAYNPTKDKINILRKDGTMLDIADAADTLNISSLARPVEKWFLCFPKP